MILMVIILHGLLMARMLEKYFSDQENSIVRMFVELQRLKMRMNYLPNSLLITYKEKQKSMFHM